MANNDNMVFGILPTNTYRKFLQQAKANGGEMAYAESILRSVLEGEMIATGRSENSPDSSPTEMAAKLESLRAEVADLRREIGAQMTMQDTTTNELISTIKYIRRSQQEMEKIFRKLLDQAAG